MARRRKEADAVASKNPTSQMIDSPGEAEAASVAARKASVERVTTPKEPRFGEIPGYQPDWFSEAYRAEIAQTNFLDPSYLQSVVVLSAMRKGDLGPLAAMLKASSEIPALIRREIVFMIEGDADQSLGNRLTLKIHPDVDGRKGGRYKQMDQHNRDQSIAAFIASRGGLDRKMKIALFEAEELFNINRTQLLKIWVRHKEWVKGLGLGLK